MIYPKPLFKALPVENGFYSVLLKISIKTYYNWQKKVFAAMLAQKQAELSDASPKFAELPPPTDEKQPTTTEKQTDLVASVRIGDASLEVYSGASSEIVSALCKVLSHAK